MNMRVRVVGTAAVVAVAALLSIVPAAAQKETAPELAAALQRKYDGIRDFSADFVHTYRGGVLNRQLRETGMLLIKKPGKMRWEYKTPERKLFVSDGLKVYYYLPQDKQVIVSKVPSDDRATTPALFLAGKGNIGRDFTASFADSEAAQPEGTRALKLVPKKPEPDYEWLVLSMDPGTLALRGLTTVDAQGGTSSFAFTNLKENIGLADKPFVFAPPRGVEIVTDSTR
jgi:outer membrane lipoprotein carrier protein